VYQPGVLGAARIRFTEPKYRIDTSETSVFVTPITESAIPVDWQNASELALDPSRLGRTPESHARYTNLPDAANIRSNYALWSQDFVNWVSGSQSLKLMQSPGTGLISNPGEAEKDFRIRLGQSTRENRDARLEQLRLKYAPKLSALNQKLAKAKQAVEREKGQATSEGLQTAVSIGTTLLGAFTGRKLLSSSNLSRASTAIRRASRTANQREDVSRAQDSVEVIQQQINELNTQFAVEQKQLGLIGDPLTETFSVIEIKARKANVAVQLVTFVWVPYTQDAQNNLIPVYQVG